MTLHESGSRKFKKSLLFIEPVPSSLSFDRGFYNRIINKLLLALKKGRKYTGQCANSSVNGLKGQGV